MNSRLSYLYRRISESFWPIPALLVVLAVAAAVALPLLDHGPMSKATRTWGWFAAIGPQGAQQVLSTIAGSTITAASLVFSLTMVVLTLAARQLGPRLLSTFTGDRVTQVVLGVFVASFVYSLLVLRTVDAAGMEDVIPVLSVSFAILLAVFSSCLLIYFIHHLAISIQADEVIARVSGDLHATIREMFTARGDEPPEDAFSLAADQGSETMTAEREGYVQAIDAHGLVRIASDRDLRIELLIRPGHFVMRQSLLARATPAGRLDEEDRKAVRQQIVIGGKRTATQDTEFAIRALVEVAVRALSPGVNDPYTAIACVDRLGAAIAAIMERGAPRKLLRDNEGAPRIRLNPITFNGLLDAAFNEIRQNAGTVPAVSIRLLETLAQLARLARTEEHREVVRKHAEMVERSMRAGIDEEEDLKVLADRLAQVREQLDASPP